MRGEFQRTRRGSTRTRPNLARTPRTTPRVRRATERTRRPAPRTRRKVPRTPESPARLQRLAATGTMLSMTRGIVAETIACERPAAGGFERLLRRSAEGDSAARAELFDHAAERLRAMARAHLRGFPRLSRWAQSDDVMQEAVCGLLRAIEANHPTTATHFYRLFALQLRRLLIDQHRASYGPEGRHRLHASPGRPGARPVRPARRRRRRRGARLARAPRRRRPPPAGPARRRRPPRLRRPDRRRDRRGAQPLAPPGLAPLGRGQGDARRRCLSMLASTARGPCFAVEASNLRKAC